MEPSPLRREETEVAQALREASVGHKLRVGAAIGSVVVLTAAVFATPGLRRLDVSQFFDGLGLQNAKRLLTAPSIAEVEFPDDEPPTRQTPQPAPKTLAAVDEFPQPVVDNDETDALKMSERPGSPQLLAALDKETTPVESEFADLFADDPVDADRPVEELPVEELPVEELPVEEPIAETPEPDSVEGPAAELEGPFSDELEVPASDEPLPVEEAPAAEEALPAAAPASEELETEFPTIEFDFTKASNSKRHNPRVFARAAELVAGKDPMSKNFAYAANIVGNRSANAFTEFSGPANRVIAAETALLASNPRRIEAPKRAPLLEIRAVDRNADAAPVAQVNYVDEEVDDKVAPADYRSTRPGGETEVPVQPSDEDLRRSAIARASLRRAGVTGARVERWNAETFRATGITRPESGPAKVCEAYGKTADEAAKALLRELKQR